MGKGILNKFPSVDKSSPLLPNLNVFSGLSGISMLIFCHTHNLSLLSYLRQLDFIMDFRDEEDGTKYHKNSEISFP